MGEGDAQTVRALQSVTLSIETGEFVAIMGPSGSGKSTLLHLLGFLDRPDTGSYFLAGRDISVLADDELAVLRNHVAGFVFQQFHLLPRLSALENAQLPLIYAGKRHLRGRALERIREVGLAARSGHHPNKLSGGEQQRVAIARSLVNEPIILFADEPTGNLDTKSEEEIMAILKQLNEAGKTIVMVTHEREIADSAKRIIFMRDGRVVSDERRDKKLAVAAPVESDFIDRALEPSKSAVRQAEFKDHLRQSVQSIISHKLRSALSMLGILIGVAAVIAMLALGEGARDSIAQRLASMGSNLLMVRPGSSRLHGVSLEAGAVTRFTLQEAEAMSKLPEIKSVSAAVRGSAQAVYGSKNWTTQVQGVGADYEAMRASVPVVGRFFNQEELRSRQKKAVIGATVARELYGTVNPVGTTLKINRINFHVIGVLPSKGSTGWHDEDDLIVIPITTAMYRVLGKQYVDSIDVEVRDAALMGQAQESLRHFIIKRHRLSKDDEDSFQIRNMAEIQDMLASTTRTMTILLGSIAAISLLVGGIGIMNIMLVSVTERTREIGLRKAIGARKADIVAQFLIESVVMTLTGGVLGVCLGSAIAFSLSTVAGWATRISPASVILATTFSAAVGILFGFWPAKQAANLDPIRALRYE
ncbi:MAG: ABC transporter permease [Candidatus Omnitrophota bacterium]